MKPGLTVETKFLSAALKDIKFDAADLTDAAMAGAYVLVNGMRLRVAVDTGATKTSVRAEVVSSSKDVVEVEIGPRTDYAPALEYGIPSKPSYRPQPFVRPTAIQDFQKCVSAIGHRGGQIIIANWPKETKATLR